MTLQQQPKPGAAEQQAHAAGLGNDGPQNALEFGQQQQQPLGELIIPEFSAYKATRLQEVVCRRNVRLYRDRLQTIHPELGTERTWYLDRSCRLEPEYVDEVMVEKRTVRSPGQWTVTAKLTTVAGSQAQQTMDLFCVTINWPTSWLATRGYTSFTLGFETYQEAAQWHALVQRQLSALRVRAASSKGDAASSAGHSSKPSYDDSLGLRGAGSVNGAGVGRKQSQGFVAAALEHFWSSGPPRDDKQSGSGVWADAADSRSANGSGVTSPAGHSAPASRTAVMGDGGLLPLQPQHVPGAKGDDGLVMSAAGRQGSFDSGYTELLDSSHQLMQQAAALAPTASSGAVEQRWVPYRHTNGVAIYHHKEPAAASCCLWGSGQGAADEPPGSEYMASSIVKGCPDECLSVLVDPSSHTTILGPASRIQLLENGPERQVLRLIVEATGMARRLCAPREVIVERLFKREECGVGVILFSSCDEPAAAAPGAGINGGSLGGSRGPGGSSSDVQGLAAAAAAAALAAAGVAAGAASSWVGCAMLLLLAGVALALCQRFNSRERFQSLWYKPVRAHVQGGYTISPQEDCNAINSPECLVTCILKVDLRGCLGERSLLRSMLDALGWVDAYIERMLMAVILVKDEVEQQRFLVQPFSMLTNSHAVRTHPSSLATTAGGASGGGGAAAPLELGDDREAASLREGYSQHLRQQQLLLRQRRRHHQHQHQHAVAGALVYGPAGGVRSNGAGPGALGAAYWPPGPPVAALPPGVAAGGAFGAYAARAGALGAPQWPYWGPLGAASGGSVGTTKQQQEALLAGGEAGAAAAASAAARHKAAAAAAAAASGQQARQQGPLGRMTSRIYSLRPRLRRADSNSDQRAGAAPAPAAGGGGPGLLSQLLSASFRGGVPPAPAGAGRSASAGAGEGVPAGVAAAAQAVSAQQQPSAAAPAAVDLSDTAAMLASVGLPPDMTVVTPQYYHGGPQGPAAQASTLSPNYWAELHVPGTPAPFKVRGSSYLADRTKVDGGVPQFVLGSVDLVETPGPTQHISRFLPAVRCNQAAYSFVVNLIIPGTPVLSLVAVFINEHHPDILGGGGGSSSSSGGGSSEGSAHGAADQQPRQACALERLSTVHAQLPGAAEVQQQGAAAAGDADEDAAASSYTSPVCEQPPDGAAALERGSDDSAAAGGSNEEDGGGGSYQRPRDTADWQPFDFVLHRFLHGDGATRQAMFKLIPHIAEGSWVIKQSVGTVPVILGNKLQTVYYETERYIEATVDVTSSSAAAYITGMVRGATKSLVIDLGFVLEGQRPEELPEALLGAFRLNHLDCTQAQRIDTSTELPLLPRPLQQHQLVQLLQQQAAVATAQAGVSAEGGGAAAAAAAAAGAAPAAEAGWAGDAATRKQRAQADAHPQQQRRAASASGASAAGASAADGTDLRRTLAAEQQQQQQQQHGAPAQVTAATQQGHSHCRSSLPPVLDGSRTMTGHARSRSAASADELLSGCGALEAEPVQALKQQLQQRCMQQLQQQPQGTAAGDAAGGAVSAHSHSDRASAPPPAAGDVGSAPPAAHEAAAAAAAAAAVPQSAARQLFGSLLPFGSNSSHTERPSLADKCKVTAAGGAAAGSSPAHGPPALQACGAVSSLSSTGTPTAAAAAAGAHPFVCSPLGPLNALAVSTVTSGSGAAHGSHLGGTGTPTAAAAAAAGGVFCTPGSASNLRTSHRRNSSSTSDAAARTPGGAWPSSPPSAGQEGSGSKLSAAAYISRAHAAALSASAQRRGQHTSAGSSGSGSQTAVAGPAAGGAFGARGPEACAGPGGGSLSGAHSAMLGAGAGGGVSGSAGGQGDAPDSSSAALWQGRRRVSSSGGPAPEPTHSAAGGASGAALGGDVQRGGSGLAQPCEPVGASAGCKLSATQQLRLAQSTLRASATGCSQGSSVSAGAPGTPAAGSTGGAPAGSNSPKQPQSKRRVGGSHRRFASLGALQ